MSGQEAERQALVPCTTSYSEQMQAAGRQLAIAARLKQDLERRRFVAVLRRISYEDASRILSIREALDGDLLDRFMDRWNWQWLSRNETLPWSLDLLERFEGRWDWAGELYNPGLSQNKALPWSLELIERFEGRWDWLDLSGNEVLPWSIELIERFADRWDWEMLSRNESLPWSLNLIERFESRWDWMWLSRNEALPWSLELRKR